jgi:hypothetical protein
LLSLPEIVRQTYQLARAGGEWRCEEHPAEQLEKTRGEGGKASGLDRVAATLGELERVIADMGAEFVDNGSGENRAQVDEDDQARALELVGGLQTIVARLQSNPTPKR